MNEERNEKELRRMNTEHNEGLRNLAEGITGIEKIYSGQDSRADFIERHTRTFDKKQMFKLFLMLEFWLQRCTTYDELKAWLEETMEFIRKKSEENSSPKSPHPDSTSEEILLGEALSNASPAQLLAIIGLLHDLSPSANEIPFKAMGAIRRKDFFNPDINRAIWLEHFTKVANILLGSK